MKLKISKNNFFGIRYPVWWSQETPAVFQLSYAWMRGFTRVGKKYYKKDYGVIVVPFKNDYGWQIMDINKSIELASYIVKQYLKDPNYIRRKIDKWKKARKNILSVFRKIDRKDLTKIEPPKLWDLYDSLLRNYIEEFAIVLIIEAFEPYTTEIFYKQFSHLDKEQRRRLSILEQPEFKSFIINQQIKFLKLALDIFSHKEIYNLLKSRKNLNLVLGQINQKSPSFYKKLKEHSNNFFWFGNNYKSTQFLTPLYFLRLLKREIKEKNKIQIKNDYLKLQKSFTKLKREKEKVIRELKLKKEVVSIYKLLEVLAWWQDERKRIMLISNHYLNKLLKRIAKVKSLPLIEVQYMHANEIRKLLLKNEYVDSKILRKRRRFSIWIGTKNREHWFVGEEAQKIRRLIFRKERVKKEAILGIPAAVGRVRGKVRIVLDPQRDCFRQNEILVTSMTRPDFVPLMKKARAVITNEGGVTCHAAIVSRELNIPCVVGTKIATKVLKSGDLVEIWAHRGTVRKIK